MLIFLESHSHHILARIMITIQQCLLHWSKANETRATDFINRNG